MKIFISYSRVDAGNFAKYIHKYLRENGHAVFIDVNSITIGDPLARSIEKNISDCDIFVVIITHASLRNTEVEKEVLQAEREDKKIIPCIHRDVNYDEIKWNLKSIQGVEFQDKYELARKLYSKIAGKRKEPPRPTDDDYLVKPQRLSLKIIIPIVTVAIIGVIVSISYFNGLVSTNENKQTIVTPSPSDTTEKVSTPPPPPTSNITKAVTSQPTSNILQTYQFINAWGSYVQVMENLV